MPLDRSEYLSNIFKDGIFSMKPFIPQVVPEMTVRLCLKKC